MSAPGTLDLAGILARAEAARVKFDGPWCAEADRRPNVIAGQALTTVGHNIYGARGVAVVCDQGIPADRGSEGLAKYIATMDPPTTIALVDEVERLTRELSDAKTRSLDSNMLAHKWMIAHDLLKAGKPYNTPRRTDLPDSISRAEAAEAEAAKMTRERDEAVRDRENSDEVLSAIRNSESAEAAKLRARVAELEGAGVPTGGELDPENPPAPYRPIAELPDLKHSRNVVFYNSCQGPYLDEIVLEHDSFDARDNGCWTHFILLPRTYGPHDDAEWDRRIAARGGETRGGEGV